MDSETPTTTNHPSPLASASDPRLLADLPMYPADPNDDAAQDYSDDPILQQSYRTLQAVNDTIHQER